MNAEIFDPVDVHWMRQAIDLCESALYVTAPNPRVACLVVRDGQLLASGVTQQAGGPHAEVMALRQAQQLGVNVAGATLYVTLEPCSHHGRTPPCADAIVQVAPAKVVVATTDPNPLVAGQGVARLRQAGIETIVGVCAEQALAVNPGFVARMTRGTPWVWLKSAVSLDGRVALNNGASQWITGPEARQDGHHWRARSCAVLTGIGTILADDPQLNVRMRQTPRQPLRVVVDSGLRLNPKARILDGLSPLADGGGLPLPGGVLVFTASDDHGKAQALAERGVMVIRLPGEDGRVDLAAAMHWLGGRAINEIHVEAGGQLSGALLQAGLVDELLVYMAPVLLGEGQPMAVLPELQNLAQAQRYVWLSSQALGADLRLRLRRHDRWQALCRAVGIT